MLKTNRWMYILLGFLCLVHVFSLIFNSLFYFRILGPNSNKQMKNWFFEKIQTNMSSRALEEITLEPISECSFPMLNLFGFGYPKADSVDRHCMCEETGDFSQIDEAIANGSDVKDLVSKLICRRLLRTGPQEGLLPDQLIWRLTRS